MTDRQRQIIEFLREREAAGLPAPSRREIQDRIGAKSLNTVTQELVSLATAGIVTWRDCEARSLRLVPDEIDMQLERVTKRWRSVPGSVRREIVRIVESDAEMAGAAQGIEAVQRGY